MKTGDVFGPSSWIEVSQSQIDTFAEATGDHQWIHVDPERAKDGPFGTTIAHGYLTLSLIPVHVVGGRAAPGADGDQLRPQPRAVSVARAGRIARARHVRGRRRRGDRGRRPGDDDGDDRARGRATSRSASPRSSSGTTGRPDGPRSGSRSSPERADRRRDRRASRGGRLIVPVAQVGWRSLGVLVPLRAGRDPKRHTFSTVSWFDGRFPRQVGSHDCPFDDQERPVNIETRIQEQTRQLEAQWAARRALGRHRAHVHAPRTSCACAARSCRSARSAGSEPSGCGSLLTRGRGLRERARRDHRRPGRPDGQGRPAGDLPLGLAGRGRREPRRARRTPTRASTRRTRCRRSCGASNNALQRADQIEWSEGRNGTDWLAPIVADAEAGFGGALNAYELMRAMIEAGAAGVHFEDQLAAEKKCGHLGGKVLVPTSQFIRTLTAARLAADVLNVPTVLIARTDALSATLLTSDIDERDVAFITGERTSEGFYTSTTGSRRDRPLARVRPVRRHALVRDLDARPRRGSRVRRRRSTRSSRASSSPTTARRRSTGASRSPTSRSPASSESSATGATASSSSRSPASTR